MERTQLDIGGQQVNVIMVEGPSSKIPRSESELAQLALGSVVRVTHAFPYRNWDVYEGVVNGKDAFMLQDARDPAKINSFRCKRNELIFCSHYGILMPRIHTSMVQYTPEDSFYDSKKQMLIDARHWRDAK